MGNDERAEIASIAKGDAAYPPALTRCLDDQDPATLAVIGNGDLLRRQTLALFCSVTCPGTVILRTYDLARSLRDAGIAVIGGFQSPMEREFLTLLLRGSGPVIVCPARDIAGMRIPREWRAPLSEGRVLMLSSFDKRQRRATSAQATARNLVVAALADNVLIPYAAPGGKTEALAQMILTWGKGLLTVESDDNSNLIALGARTVGSDDGRVGRALRL